MLGKIIIKNMQALLASLVHAWSAHCATEDNIVCAWSSGQIMVLHWLVALINGFGLYQSACKTLLLLPCMLAAGCTLEDCR